MSEPTPFLLEPAGSAPRVERLSFGTDVETHRDGSERRAAFRAFPRLSLSAQFTLLKDRSESALAPLRDGNTLLVPAWPHQFVAPDGGPPVADAGVVLTEGPQPFLVRALDGTWRVDSFGFGESGQLAGWSTSDWLAVPLHFAELAEDSLDIGYSTPTVRGVSPAFDVADNFEAPESWPEALEELSFPQRHNWTADLREGITFRTNRFDAGNLRLREKLYSKRSISIAVLLTDRAAIVDFRRWVYATRGRLNSFTWQAPQDSTARRWRLASDDIEIQYLKPALASCNLTFIETNS